MVDQHGHVIEPPRQPGTSGEVGLDHDEIKAELRALLDDVDTHSLGSFATSASIPHAVNPGITVDDLGGIGLPLSRRDALELGKVAHQAPFGKRTETIVDESVRKTWELNSSQFTLQNPDWQQCMQGLVGRVANELGVIGGAKAVRAELYKLLLYEEGAFFERHKDSEKASGMFGTLVVALPSSHQGGDVQTSFGTQERILKTAPASKFGFSYADVDHAVLPVTSGYRLVLTFNLLSQGKPQLAASLGDHQAKFCNLLASWARSIQRMDGDAPLQLVYILEHEYTQAGLRLDRLKGNDRRKVAYLKGACDEQKFCVCLAQLELSKVGGVDENEDGYDSECLNDAGYHELYEVCDTQLSLLKIYDIDGTEIATDVELSEEDVVQEDSLEGVDPDDEDYSGPTGNEGVSATHFYHRTCVVNLPRNRKINFLFEAKLKGKTDLEPWVDTMFQKLYEKPGDTNLVNDLESFCHCVIERNHGNRGKAQMGGIYYPWKQTQSLPDTTLSTAALVSLRLRSADVLERIAKVSHDMLLPSVYEGLGKIIAQEGLKKWEISLEKAFTCIASIRSHRDALYYVRKGFNTVDGLLQREAPDIDDLSTKIWEALLSKLDSVASVDPSGAGPLLEMASRLGEGALLGPIASLVEKHISQVEFVMSFLYLLKGYPEIDMNTLQQVHGDIHGKLAANFSIHKAFATRNMSDKPAFPSASGPRYRYDHRMAQTKEKTGATTQDKIQKFAVFLSQSLSWNVANNVFQIIDKIAAEVPHVGDFSIILIPFLRATALTDLKADESGHYQNSIRTTLTAYTERFVGMEPARPQDWTRPRAGCGCRNCDILGNWLTDPSQKQIRYDGLVQDPKRHLTDRLGPESECRYEYDRSAKPQALVITKTQSRWEQDHREWSRRCTEAVKNIHSIAPKPDLEHLLESLYSPLLDLTAQRLPPNAPRTQPPSVAMLKVTPKSPEPRTMTAAWGTKNKIMAGTRNPPSLTRPPLQATTAQNRPTPPPTAGVKRPHAQLDIVDLT